MSATTERQQVTELQWTDREIQLVRRNLAYHQKCSLHAVGKDDARAFIDEQQRRLNHLYGNYSRWDLGGGTLYAKGETVSPWKTWPLGVAGGGPK